MEFLLPRGPPSGYFCLWVYLWDEGSKYGRKWANMCNAQESPQAPEQAFTEYMWIKNIEYNMNEKIIIEIIK